MRKAIQVVLIIAAIIVLTLTSSAREINPNTHIWNPAAGDHGSFGNIQQLVDSILVDPASQSSGVESSFVASAPAGMNDALGHVYTSLDIAGLVPTAGDTFVIMSTGKAGPAVELNNDSNVLSTIFNENSVDPDSFTWYIPLNWTGTSSILEFDSRFMSEEPNDPINVGPVFNDNFTAYICNDLGVSCGDPIMLYSVEANFFDPANIAPPSGTDFDWSTPLETTRFDVSTRFPADTTFMLKFVITDAGGLVLDENGNILIQDNQLDSAVFLDRLSFVPPEQPAIPEFPTIVFPVAAVIGLMFLFSRKEKAE